VVLTFFPLIAAVPEVIFCEWRDIVVQHPIACNVLSGSLDPFSKSFQDIFVEGVIKLYISLGNLNRVILDNHISSFPCLVKGSGSQTVHSGD
jgi:hypothetical protein